MKNQIHCSVIGQRKLSGLSTRLYRESRNPVRVVHESFINELFPYLMMSKFCDFILHFSCKRIVRYVTLGIVTYSVVTGIVNGGLSYFC